MAGTIESPSGDAVAITPHDSTNFTEGVCRGIYVGVGGNVVAITAKGQTVTFKGLEAGMILPVKAKRVNSTDTTATDLVALY